MGAIGRWIRHLVGSMFRGFLVMLILAAVVCVAAVLLVAHTLPTGLTLAFVIALSLISGLLGAFAMLAWRLSHISELAKLSHEAVERLAHHDPSSGRPVSLPANQQRE